MPNSPRMGLGTPSQMSAGPGWLISLETREVPPAAGRMPTCQRTASGSHSRGGSGYTGEPSSVVTPGSGSPSRRRGRGCRVHGMRRAAPQGHGADLLQGGELQVPAFPPGRHRAFRDRAELAGRDELAVGAGAGSTAGPGAGAAAPGGACRPRRRTGPGPRTARLPARSRDPGRPARRGRRGPAGSAGARPADPRAAPHRDGIAVRGHLPGGDPAGCCLAIGGGCLARSVSRHSGHSSRVEA